MPLAGCLREASPRQLCASDPGHSGPDDADVDAAAASIERQVKRELDYWDGLPAVQSIEGLDVLKRWADHERAVPHLAALARWAPSIPGSSASLARLFSAAGRAITRRRPRLKPRRAAGLIFGHLHVTAGCDGRTVFQPGA